LTLSVAHSNADVPVELHGQISVTCR